MKVSRTEFVDAYDMRLCVRHWGDESAPKLFMIHGWMDISASFQFVVDAFKRDWHVIAPDMRGFGHSGWAKGGYWFPDYLADLDELMPEAAGEDWKELYSEKCLEQGNQLTGGDTKMLVLTNSGSMVGFYNAALLKEIGCEVPKTFEEYKAVAEAFKAKYPDKYVSVFAGKDAWVVDEMMLTVLGQQGDYYNKWRYEEAPVDSPEYKQAIDGLKKYFDEGIFSPDVLDLDYASATEEFTNGNALIYYMGSWEAPLLSNKLREGNGIELENVGAMALPVAEEGGQLTVRSYIDSGIGVVDYSEKKEAAAKFVAYLTVGEGADIFGKQLTGTSAKKDFVVDETLFDTEESKAGWDTVNELINTATADRNNVSGYSDVEGAAVQSVLNGSATTEDVLKDLQKEWTSGKY